jgi:hypothetical protein
MGAATRFESLGGLGLVAITAKADCALHLSDAVGRIRCARKRSACHICAGSGLTPHTSATGLGSPRTHLHWDFAGPCLPHLRRDCAHACHICAGTGLTPATSALGLASPPATSAPGLGSRLPHLRRDWARSQVTVKDADPVFNITCDRLVEGVHLRCCHLVGSKLWAGEWDGSITIRDPHTAEEVTATRIASARRAALAHRRTPRHSRGEDRAA